MTVRDIDCLVPGIVSWTAIVCKTPIYAHRCFVAQGNYDEAEQLYRRLLAMQEKALGPEDSRAATTLRQLAGCSILQVKI